MFRRRDRRRGERAGEPDAERARPAPAPPRARRRARCSALDVVARGRRWRCSSSRRRRCSRGSRRARSTGASLADVVGRARRPRARCSSLRGALAWGFEVAGRRARDRVLSQLRLELVEARLRRQPAALDGAQSAEVATAAVARARRARGVLRPLPAAGRARRRRPASRSSRWSPRSTPRPRPVMLLTLPLVPVFMWLIGRYTERGHASGLAALDAALDPLPRRRPRAADAPRLQPRDGAGGARSRTRATTTARRRWGRCASRSSPGAVLELAATLGIALVAVTVGVRLVDGGIGFEAGAHRARCSPPSCTCRSATSPRSTTRAPTGSPSPSACSTSPTRRRRRAGAVDALPAGDGVGRAARGRLVRVPGAARRSSSTASTSSSARARRSRSSGRAGAGRATLASLLLGLGPTPASTGGVLRTAGACGAWVPQRPTLFRGTVADNIRLGDPDADDAACRGRGAAGRGEPRSSRRCPTGYETVVGDGGRAALGGRGPADRARARVPARRAARRPRRADREPRSRERRG